MLTQKQKELPYIAVFKMGNGEEFIAKVVDETLTGFSVIKPLTLGQTAEGIRFVPVLMLADPEKPISIPKPIISAEPAPGLLQQYETAISGIALPKKSSIVTS